MIEGTSDELTRLVELALKDAEDALRKHVGPIARELLKRQLASVLTNMSASTADRDDGAAAVPSSASADVSGNEFDATKPSSSAPDRVLKALEEAGTSGLKMSDLVDRASMEDGNKSTVRRAIDRLRKSSKKKIYKRDDMFFLAGSESTSGL